MNFDMIKFLSKIFILFFTTVKFSNMSSQNPINYLVQALTEINHPKTLRLALDLSLTNNNLKTYDFIQKGNLGYSDIKKIAIVINKIKIKNNPYLKILSMSFNQNLKGEGLDLILNVIPKSTKVLAFVECGLSN